MCRMEGTGSQGSWVQRCPGRGRGLAAGLGGCLWSSRLKPFPTGHKPASIPPPRPPSPPGLQCAWSEGQAQGGAELSGASSGPWAGLWRPRADGGLLSLLGKGTGIYGVVLWRSAAQGVWALPRPRPRRPRGTWAGLPRLGAFSPSRPDGSPRTMLSGTDGQLRPGSRLWPGQQRQPLPHGAQPRPRVPLSHGTSRHHRRGDSRSEI